MTEKTHIPGVDTEHAGDTFKKAEYDDEIKGIIALVREYAQKYKKEIPVVTAGGIYSHEDVMHQLELGADGVQVATRFVTTEECDAPMEYKQAYLDAKEEDIIIVKSLWGCRDAQSATIFCGRWRKADKRFRIVTGAWRNVIRLKYLTVSRRPLSTQ